VIDMAKSQRVDGDGDPCPRCKQPTEIREHASIGPTQLAKPFYFARWFLCVNPDCPTTIIHAERFKVVNEHPTPRAGPQQPRLSLAEPEPEPWPDTGPQDGPPPWE
jgi:hypothetical protein